MKIILRRLLLLSVLMIILIFLPDALHAQGGPGDPGCDPLDPGCPIDGGLGLLLSAGVYYGIRKMREASK